MSEATSGTLLATFPGIASLTRATGLRDRSTNVIPRTPIACGIMQEIDRNRGKSNPAILGID
jgi:hypothetical protein